METQDIQIKDIISKANVRKEINDDSIRGLMQTIKDNGLLQPIGVKEEKDGKYIIIWGNRRLNACTKLGWKSISAVIFSKTEDKMSEEQFFVLNMLENEQKKSLSLFELGSGIKKLRKTMSIPEIAIRLGISESKISMAIGELQRIPSKWQKKIKLMNTSGSKEAGSIPMTSAVRVSRLKKLSSVNKNKLLKHISTNNKSAQNIELIGSIMETGKDLNEALEESSNYKSIGVQFFVNKEDYDYIMKKNKDKNNAEFVVECINKKYPGLAITNLASRGVVSSNEKI